jgi:recombination protein RecR
MQYTKTLNKVIEAFNRLPGIGPKMAERLSLHILKMKDEDVLILANAILEVKKNIKNCSICGSITEDDTCSICTDLTRNKDILCVVEQVQDVWAIERTREYKGLYHVLLGSLSPLDGIGPNEIRIKELLERLKHQNIQEIIIATNPTVEGEATAMYISKLIKPFVSKVSRIAHGVPVGADLEYTDEITIARAMEGRQEI